MLYSSDQFIFLSAVFLYNETGMRDGLIRVHGLF